MNLGNELKKDYCPEKYYAKGSIIKESMPTIVALVIVAFFSGNMFGASGMNMAVTIIIEAIFVIGLYALMYVLFKGMKKRLAETYISVCENGVCGICPVNGYKNRNFESSYEDINKMEVKGERLFLYTKSGNVCLTLKDAKGTAELIKSKNQNL